MIRRGRATPAGRLARWAVALACVLVGVTPLAAWALPTASFTFAPNRPTVGQAVSFDFTGTCDAPPCRVVWRWFQDGGSSLGTLMGEGEHIQYAFDAAGTYAVTVKVTNALSTHGSATATQTVVVDPVAQPLSASFTFTPDAPTAGQPVAFDFTGNCDQPPCQVRWEWSQDPATGPATPMGEGVHLSYAFPAAGSYQVVVTVTNAVSAVASATRTVVVAAAPPDQVIQDTDRRVELDGWAGAATGDYRIGQARATVTVAGDSVTYVAMTGPQLGGAEVRIDGVLVRQVGLRSPNVVQRSWTFVLAAQPAHHVVTVQPAVARPISLDEFVVRRPTGATHVDDTSTRITYGGWRGSQVAAAAGGSVRMASRPGSAVAFSFTGDTLTWITATGPGFGRTEVQIDGVSTSVVDNAADTRSWGVRRTFAGLGTGPHRAVLTLLPPTGTQAAGAAVDAFAVQPQ